MQAKPGLTMASVDAAFLSCPRSLPSLVVFESGDRLWVSWAWFRPPEREGEKLSQRLSLIHSLVAFHPKLATHARRCAATSPISFSVAGTAIVNFFWSFCFRSSVVRSVTNQAHLDLQGEKTIFNMLRLSRVRIVFYAA